MFTVKLFFVVVTVLFLTKIEADSNGNIHLFKKEIGKAMEYCDGSKDGKDTAKDGFDRRASSAMSERYRRDNDQNSYENDSEDWDYEDGNNDSGKFWNNPQDVKYSTDSIYNHERRNNSRTSNVPQKSSDSVKDQNSTKLGEKYVRENNFDNRGGRFVSDYSKSGNNQGKKSDDLGMVYNSNNNFSLIRKKRNIALLKSSIDNEVDDRGIPKEPLFIKLVQDTITSQQTKSLIEKQIQSCFRELMSAANISNQYQNKNLYLFRNLESQDNECSYSNALERCMALQLIKRKNSTNES